MSHCELCASKLLGVARNRRDQRVVEIECTVSRQCVNKKSQRRRGSALLCTPGSEALVRLGQRRVLFWTLFCEVVEVGDHKRVAECLFH